MRWAVLLGMGLSSGCTALDQMRANRGASPDPARIYLSGNEEISVRKWDIEDYACSNGKPLICADRGIDLDCFCTAQ